MRTREAAAYLCVSPSTLNKLRSSGGGPVFIKLEGSVLYAVDDLDEWAASRRVRSTSETVGA
jgi:uroporphyrinogen-III synthase